MSIPLQDLRQRYLWIAKNSLQFLKEKGFKKEGQKKYVKKKGDLIFKIYSLADPRPWARSDHSYEFDVWWEVETSDPDLVQLWIFRGANKNIKNAYLLGSNITPEHLKGRLGNLTDHDSPDYDQKYIEGIKNEIETVILPLFEKINSIDDIIKIAEAEEKLTKEKRYFFTSAIYSYLAGYYAAKGWKDKTLEMCDKHIETTPATARDLAEKRKKKYIEYFEKVRREKQGNVKNPTSTA